jgi:hypothetical protein
VGVQFSDLSGSQEYIRSLVKLQVGDDDCEMMET